MPKSSIVAEYNEARDTRHRYVITRMTGGVKMWHCGFGNFSVDPDYAIRYQTIPTNQAQEMNAQTELA